MQNTGNAIDFEQRPIKERLIWAHEHYGDDLVATSSFQSQSVPLLHLISRHIPSVPILFLDTGFHFPETIAFKERLTEQLSLNVFDVTSKMGHKKFKQKFGALHEEDPDLCCYINKVEPLERHLEKYEAWITGIRGNQTEERKETGFIQKLDNNITKICPIWDWTNHDLWTYNHLHGLPEHPLLEQGYLSVGCAPCTQPTTDGQTRSGRWPERNKTECGIHSSLG